MVEHALGKGGMGSVYAVRDLRLERSVALKYLKREAAQEKGPAAALFQREYHTLAQLRHPRVIQVFDYGIDAGRPFYTMELLDGSDLRELSPVPWRRACQLLRDVASSLALLHSRRLLHRDLSPRNVRCTRDGQAKLIDFGTMTTMGVARDVAGTAPYMAPEAVHCHALDARTDLYALGALAYWTLTGFDAYPARDTRELRSLWVKPVVAPSTWVRDIPEALDALVMALLSLDPHARPAHVAEVIERLTAIAGLEPIESMEVARAYVAAPPLIGHSENLGSFHKRLVRGARGRGSALHIEGAPGLGRSRLLDAFALEAKLCGAIVARAQGGGPQREDLDLLRTLLEGLVDAAPDPALAAFAPYASVLGPWLPSLFSRLPSEATTAALRCSATERVARLEQAARAFLAELADQHLVVLTIDDLDAADAASIASLGLLGRESADRRLVVCTSAQPMPASGPLAVLAQSAARVELAPFEAAQTDRLLRSVFGDVPHLQAVSEWVHAVSQGVPATALELIQYLVDHRIARYERGSWSLPDAVREQPLPASLEQAHEAQLAMLSEPSRDLAAALALVTEQDALDVDEVAALGRFAPREDAYRALLELEAARVVVSSDGAYALRRRGLERTALRRLSHEGLRAQHAALATMYEARVARTGEDVARLLAAHHFHLAEQPARAFEVLCEVKRIESRFGRSRASVAMHLAALEHGRAACASASRLYVLERAIVQLSLTTDLALSQPASRTLEHLLVAAGHGHFARAGRAASPPPSPSLAREIIAHAQSEHVARGGSGLEPARALAEVGYVASVLASVHTTRGDIAALEDLAERIAPLCPFFVGFEVLLEMIGQAADSLARKRVLERRLATLDKLAKAAKGLTPGARLSAQVALTYWSAMEEALQAQPSALARADWLAAQPSYEGLAARIRGVFHLFTGDEQGAEGCRKHRELLALSDPQGASLTDARGVIYEAWGYYVCGSVLGMRRVLAVVAEHAARLPCWQRDLRLLRGLYDLLRGQPARAVAELHDAGSDGALALACIAAGDFSRARAIVLAADASCELRARIPPERCALLAARALAQAELGEAPQALAALASDVEAVERDGVQGMLLCMLHEAAARISITCDDRAAFRTHVRRLGALYGRGANGLRARYEHLGAVARRAMMTVPPPPGLAETVASEPEEVRTRIEQAGSASVRVERALHAIAQAASARIGYLFGLQASGLRLVGQLGGARPPEGIEDMLAFYLDAELASGDARPRTLSGTFSASASDLVAWINDGEQLYFPVLLTCTLGQERVIAGVVVLGLDAQRAPHVPDSLVAEVSRALIEAGDVVFARAAD